MIQEKKKQKQDEYVGIRHNLNTLFNRSNDLELRTILKGLKVKYNTERRGTDMFLMAKYCEFKIADDTPIIYQVHVLQLQVFVDRLHNLKVTIQKIR